MYNSVGAINLAFCQLLREKDKEIYLSPVKP